MQVISQSPISSVPFISGNSDIDVAAREYIYATAGAIYRVDLDTGELLSQASIQAVYSNGSEFFVNLAYHWQDQVMYGLHFYTPQPVDPFGSPCQGELRLARIDPQNGEVTIISQSPVSPDCFSIGDSDIDVQGGRFIYLRSGRAYAVDIATGEALSNTILDNPDNAIAAMINMTYDDFAQQPVQPIPMDMGTSVQLEVGVPLVLDAWNGDEVQSLWNTGETTSSIEVEEPGTYSVILERAGVQMEGSIEVVGGAVSVPDIDEEQLRIYPNPTADLLFMEGVSNIDLQTARILSTDGRVIKEWTRQDMMDGVLDLQEIADGNYLLELWNAEQRMVRSVLIAR